MSVGTLVDRTLAADAGRARVRAWASDPVLAVVAALTVLAAALRFAAIGHQGFWFDEGNTALLVHFSPGKMFGLLPQSESTPPLYYCLAWVWARMFGFSEAPLRSLSALVGVLTVPVAYATARRFFSPRAGVVAAALVACNPLLIWYSQEARAYALLVLTSALSLLAFAYARETPAPRRLTAWAVGCALALATHYYALLVVVPEALWLLVQYRRRPAVLAAIAAVAACGLALLPLALSQESNGLGNWIAKEPLLRRLGQVIPQFVVGFNLPGQSVLEPVGVALAAAAAVFVFWRGEPRARRLAACAGGLALGGLVLNLLLIAAGIDDLLTRNLLALWMPAALVVTAGLSSARAGVAGIAATVVLCAIGVTGAVGVDTQRRFERPDWRGVARVLGARPAPATGERLIFVQHYRDLLPLSLYMPGLKFMRGRSAEVGARVRELDIVSFTSPSSDGFCWWGSACNLWGSRMQSSYAVAGFRPLWRRRVYQFTVLRLVAARPTRVTAPELAGALHTTRYRDDELLAQP